VLFSETLASMQPQSSGWRAHIGEDWSQGRATFGGMVAALCNEAMRRLVPADRELRGLDTTFAGPALVGEVSIDAEVLRAGKAVTIARSRLWSDGKVAATLTGIYGAARTTALSLAPAVAAGVPAVEDLPESPAGVIGGPSFVQHFAYRWAEGTRPFAGSSLRTAKIYVRHKDPAPLTESHVVALIDSIPSVVLQLMTTVAPSSSLT
jgi:acyl-CoA thioesterase